MFQMIFFFSDWSRETEPVNVFKAVSADVNSTLRLFQLCETLYWPQSFFLLLIIVQLSFSKKYINHFILSLCIDTQTHTNEHQTPTFGSELSGFRVPYRHNIHIADFFPFVCLNQRVDLLVQVACGVS